MTACGCPKAEVAGSPLYLGPRKLFLNPWGTLDLAPPPAHWLTPVAWTWHYHREAEGQLSGTHRTTRVSHRLRGLPVASANGVHTSTQQPANVTRHSPRGGLPTPEFMESHTRRFKPLIRLHTGRRQSSVPSLYLGIFPPSEAECL